MHTRQLRRILTLSLLITVLILANSSSDPAAAAGPWYVAPSGDNSNDCLSPGTPCETINAAIGKATSGDLIYIAEGTYTDSGTFVVIANKSISLSAGWDPSFSIQDGFSTIDGERARSGVYVQNGVTADMERLRVMRGSLRGVENVGTLTLVESEVRWNADTGVSNGGTLTINNSVITENAGGEGGGVRNWSGTLILNQSSVAHNDSRNRGGGIRNDATMHINNSTISSNRAGNRGGGISNYNGTLTINSSTLAGNYAADGGGIHQEGGTVTLQNTILATNTANSGQDCMGTIGSAGYNLVGDASSCGFSSGSGDLTGTNPDLGSLIGPTDYPQYQPLFSGSPAINGGNPTDCLDHSGTPLTTDQRGLARVGTCDIGAYEYSTPGTAAQLSAAHGTFQRTEPLTEFDFPLQAAVLDGVGSPVQGVSVNFDAPSSGASGTFVSSGSETTSAVTNESGIATTSTFTANALEGTYTVSASAGGIPTPAEFTLSNVFWYVKPSGNNSNSCQNGVEACETVNGVLVKPDYFPGDSILVASGTYTSSDTEVVSIATDSTLLGGWDDTFSIQDGWSILEGENTRRVLRVIFPATVRMERFIIQNGSENTGAGIINGGQLWLSHSIVKNNIADHSSGGILTNGTLYLINSTVQGNQALYYGGGGLDTSGHTYIVNSTISNNFAEERGGGIFIDNGTLDIYSSTITNNRTYYSGGGGIYRYSYSSATVTMQNSILAENIGGTYPDCLGVIYSNGNNILGNSNGCTFSSTPSDLIDADPNLGPLMGEPGYHPLISGSLAIDAGNASGCEDQTGSLLLLDQRGASRVGVCDIGAYEYTTTGAPHVIAAYRGSPQSSPTNVQYWHFLEALVLDDIGTPIIGATVTFTAPSSGPSGIFEDTGIPNTSAVTNEFGIATAAPFIANALEGAFSVEATVGGASGPATFDLLNGGWYVTPTGDHWIYDCRTPTTPCESINAVLFDADYSSGDTILVSGGTYTGGGSEVAKLDKDVRIIGGWDLTFSSQSGSTIYDGEDSRRGFTIEEWVNAHLDQISVQIGHPNLSNGGGILNSGNLHLRNCTILDNFTGFWGGGISSGFGTHATLILENCKLSGNTAGGGSGGLQGSGSVEITNSVINGNTGGGVYGSGITIHDSTIVSNGGNGITSLGTVKLINSIISGNIGNGIDGSNVSIYNTTIANNDDTGIASQGSIELENSIVSGNGGVSTPDCSGDLISLGYNIIGDTSGCTFSPAFGDLLDMDPALGPLTGSPEHHPLLSGSPAINAGNPSGCADHRGVSIDRDIRGAPRLARCDIGAYEAQSYKDVNEDDAMPGDTLSFTIRFQNWLATPQLYIITDTLPSELTYVNGTLSATQGTPNYSAGAIIWSDTVAAGQDVTISFDAQIGAVVGEIINEAEIDNSVGIETRSATVCVDAPICSVTKYASNPVLTDGTPGSWDDEGIWHPSVLLEGSTYKMWYAGYDDTNLNQIGLATSPDGYAWTKEGSNPVLHVGAPGSWEENGVSRPKVILDGSTYKMWYTGVDSSGVIQVGYATSPDGISWTKHPGNPVLAVGAASSWEDEDVTGPTVLKDNGTYQMWYAGNAGSMFRIGHATSIDGIAWIKDPANPVLDVGGVGEWDWLGIYSPDVVKVGDSYKLWYSGETLPQAWQTGYAESTDGSSWTRKGMMIPEGPPGTFDTNSADHPAVLIDGSTYRVWYGGIDDGGTYTIGLAEAQLCTGGAYTLYLPLVMKDYSPAPPCPPDYADDFSDPESGWLVYEDADVKYDYTGGEYQIWLKNPSAGRWVTPGAKASDFTVAVSARRTSGTDGPYGILFGINEDWSELYMVVINEDYYDILRYDSGWTFLASASSPDILTGTAWNRIKVTRDGTAISLYINDQFQTTVYDGSFTGFRRIGLSVYSPSGSDLDVRFDDFAIYPASCGPIAADVTGVEWAEAEAHEGIVPPKPEEIE